MKDNVIVASVQMNPKWMDAKENIRKMKDAISQARHDQNADIVIFPELNNIGYIKERNKIFGRDYYKHAEKIPGDFTNAISEYAKKFSVYVITGMAERHPSIPGMLYNSAILISPKGTIEGIHRKVHIPGEEKHYFYPANEIKVMETEIGNIGIAICYDNQFPELTRTLALQGCEILCMLFNMPSFSNSPKLLYYYTAARAAENRMYAISCNRIGKEDETIFLGHSAIADPIGNLIATAESEDTILYGNLSNDRLLEERAQQPVFRDRRPDVYGELVKPL